MKELTQRKNFRTLFKSNLFRTRNLWYSCSSLEYFDKSIKELNYSEAALLAALPKAPSKYNPYKYPEVAKFRRNLVLENLEENNLYQKNN